MADLPGFIGADNVQTAQEVDIEMCVNLYPEIQDSPIAKAKIVLYGSPGLTAYMDIGTGPIRGTIDTEGYTDLISGNHAYRIAPSGLVTDLGLVADDGLPVTIVASTTQVLFVSAGFAYVLDGAGLTPVATPPWTSAADCAYLDGLFVILDDNGLPVGGQIFITDDAHVWDPLDFSTAPSSNNKLLALATDHEELWIYGSVVTQVFYNNGNADFPLVPNLTAVIQQGIQAKSTRASLDNTLFWIGRNSNGTLQAFLADGYRPQRISTHAIEQQWLKYQNPSDAVAWTYQINGHPTYHVNFNTAQKSWRFDRATNLWHRVAWRNPATNVNEQHRGNCHCVRLGLHIVGDRQTGQLWQLAPLAYADGPNPLVALRRAPAVFAGNKMVFYKIFEIITPGGIGDGTNTDPTKGVVTPEANPTWMYRWSNDSGHTWSPEFQLKAGPQGAFGTRLRKVGCGAGRARVNEVSMSAAVPRCLIAAEVDVEIGLT